MRFFEGFGGGCSRNAPSCVRGVVCGICCLRGVTDKGLIDGVVNKYQGSLPASAAAARGAKDKETEAQRLTLERGLRMWTWRYLFIYIRKVLITSVSKGSRKGFGFFSFCWDGSSSWGIKWIFPLRLCVLEIFKQWLLRYSGAQAAAMKTARMQAS